MAGSGPDLPGEKRSRSLTNKLSVWQPGRRTATKKVNASPKRAQSTASDLRLVDAHASDISRTLIRDDVELSEAHSLFKDTINPSTPTIGYVFALSRRSRLAENLARMLATHELVNVSCTKASTALALDRYHRHVTTTTRNLRPHLMIISHMLQTYRSSMAELVQDFDLVNYDRAMISNIRVRSWRKEIEILKLYNEMEICRTSMVFELLKKVLCRQLRPASYATYVERRVRGWTKPSATDQQVVSLMIFGGLEAIKRVMSFRTYNERIEALHDGLSHLTSGISREVSQLPVSGSLSRVAMSLVKPLYLFIINRLSTVIPDRVRFFNVGELEVLVGSHAITSKVPSEAFGLMRSVDFLTLLRSDSMNSDFELRR
ncbi:MAG: hypothetical protein Q9179_006624 [Wetmoreana sp. 5 TL-2023]